MSDTQLAVAATTVAVAGLVLGVWITLYPPAQDARRLKRGYFAGFLVIGAATIIIAWKQAGRSQASSARAEAVQTQLATTQQELKHTQGELAAVQARLGVAVDAVKTLQGELAVSQLKVDKNVLMLRLRDAEREKASAEERARRRAIADVLGGFIGEGRALALQCLKEAEPPPTAAADQWGAKVEAYLTANLGAGMVPRFRSHAGLPMMATAIQSRPHERLWSGIQIRVARLEQFAQELNAR